MQYTTLGQTGLNVSRLGFGCMRLPMTNEEKVDRDKAIPMLHRAFDLGVNLYDTAVFYCHGDSQRVVGEAFEDRREDVILSTKNHHYDKSDPDGWWKHLEDSLDRLRTDYIDIYNHHGLNYDKFEDNVAGEDGIYQQMREAKEQGLIRHICFSFHGTNEQLTKLVDTGLYDTVILQYNLLDRHLEEGIAHAAENGMGVMVMGPVGGGRLGYPSDKAASLVGDVKSTPELALRFVLSNSNVSVALSGMSTVEMVEENAATVSRAGELSADDFRQINEAIEERKKLSGLYCTGCNYCMPCPAGVDIPKNFEILNLERVFGLSDHAREQYEQLDGKAALCKLCGKCLEPCPQNIDIPQHLSDAVQTFDSRAGTVVGWTKLRGGGSEENTMRLDLRYHLKNFTEEQRGVDIEFHTHGEEQIEPKQVQVEALPAAGQETIDTMLWIPEYAQSYHFDVLVCSENERVYQEMTDVIAKAPLVQDYTLLGTNHEDGGIHVPNVFHPVRSEDIELGGRHFDFSVCADAANLYVYVDCVDDLTGATEDGEVQHAVRIYVDGRDPGEICSGGYEKGVNHVTVSVDSDGGVEVESTTDMDVETLCKRTPTGYHTDLALPWSEFCRSDKMPGVIGFDVRMASTQPGDDEPLRMNWTGREKPDQDPSAFGKLVVSD